MVTRRNPRRAAALKDVNMAEHHDDDEESVASSSASVKSESAEESEDESVVVPIKKKKTSTRSSSRSTRFTSSLAEPRDSIQDLLKSESPRKPLKSPAKSHSSARRRVQKEESSEEEEEEESEEESHEEEEMSDLKIQRIVASRSEPRRVWKQICSNMHTSEVEYGSRWTQDDDDDDEALNAFEERFLVKWADVSYMHCSWETQQDLVDQVEGAERYLTTFFKKSENGLLFSADERCDGDYFDPAFVQIDRVLESHLPDDMEEEPKDHVDDPVKAYNIILDRKDPEFERGTGRQFLIKWKNTSYSDMSWEFERDLILNDVDYLEDLKALEERNKKPTKTEIKKETKLKHNEIHRLVNLFQGEEEDEENANVKKYQQEVGETVFPNGGQLRDYQAEGVTWLASNFIFDRSSILCDEMGLGKTLQTAAFIDLLHKKLHARGPFLVIAPLSTIPHWQREFTTWTNLNTIVYHGSASDRKIIREQEFAFQCDRPRNAVGINASYLRKCMPRSKKQGEIAWMAQVVITTPEMLVTDDFVELANVEWEVLVVDEAHRLKNHNSRLATNLRDRRFNFAHTLLLTGTPIQNNMTELWTLLNFVSPKEFGDLDKFIEKYGDMKSKESIDELHELIRPYILRRLKEDVEKSVPPKEETLIEVELTVLQKQYYRALYEKNVQFLHKNKSKALDGPSLNNLAMQLRKCCNHPFLLNGVEEDIRAKPDHENMNEGDFLVKASGKLVLLDKLLPRLRDDGHRVLIFSQFKIMLDILEDYLAAREMKFERIDGSITGNKRQMAIDRFQSPPVEGKEAPLVMLLSTRAGGVGINLTAADTCIIFDSDWNPQNDLQAQARCHRIGQTKNVKVYRLLSRKTYEMQMFHMSSLKMGLDQAVLQGFESGGSSGEDAMTKEEVERLLRHGAYDIFNEEKAGSADAESNDFVQQDIDSILERRAKTVIHDQTGSNSNAAGGTFSKASFIAPKTPAGGHGKVPEEDIDIDDPKFWEKVVGWEKVVDDDDRIMSGKKRKRTKAAYSESQYDKSLEGTLLLSDSDGSSDDSESDSEDEWSVQDASQGSPDSTVAYEDVQVVAGKKLVKRKKERTKWGGSKQNQWASENATKVMRAMQSYGYGNLSWDEFVRKGSINTSNLDTDEVKRMAWSLVLFCVKETAEDDTQNAKRRADKKAEKERLAKEAEAEGAAVKEIGGVLGSNLDEAASKFDLEEQLSVSFKRLVDANVAWLSKVIQDATEYAKANSPRSKNTVERARQWDASQSAPRSLESLFTAQLWASLKTRGWSAEVIVDGEFSGTTYYKHSGKEYRSPHAVLNVVPDLHPELKKNVEGILSSAGCAPDWREEDIAEARRLDLSTCSLVSVSTFLDMFAPLQLVVDRKKHKSVPFHRKTLGSCSSMLAAHSLLKQASGIAGPSSTIAKLANGLTLNKQIAKPHPLWTAAHDAVLITAIAKHGWPEQDSCIRAITGDTSIKWGAPFDADNGSGQPSNSSNLAVKKKSSETEMGLLRGTAQEAAEFLNTEQELIGKLKGFNQDQVVKTYGLVQKTGETDSSLSPSAKAWVVDDKLLLENLNAQVPKGQGDEANGSDDAEIEVDLPSKKELLKRAKTVLSRANFVSDNSKKTAASVAANPSPDHDFSVLDPNDPCNLFLTEMLRGLLKMSFGKDSAAKKNAKYHCSNALHEARRLFQANKKIYGENNSQTKELERIADHIRLVSRTMLTSSRQSKNVVRAILGESPVLPKPNSAETVFPFVGTTFTSHAASMTTTDKAANSLVAASIAPTVCAAVSTTTVANAASGTISATTNAPMKPAPTTQKKASTSNKGEVAAGNRAISRGVSKGFEQNKEAKGKFSEKPDPSTLELTATESLILSILCTHGLPVWSEDHVVELVSNYEGSDDPQLHVPCVDGRLSWRAVGIMIRDAAVCWIQGVVAKLERYRAREVTASNRAKLLADIQDLEREEEAKRRALSAAQDDVANPLKFAKKCILLLEAVRLRIGPLDTNQTNLSPKKRAAIMKSENYLGPYVLGWLRAEVARWARSLEIADYYGNPLSSTASSSDRDGEQGFTLFSVMSKQHCRAVIGQIAQLTRYRSISLANGTDEMRDLVQKAIKQSKKSDDVWEEKPEWWNTPTDVNAGHDYELLKGLMYYGFNECPKIFSCGSFRVGKENYVDGEEEVEGSPLSAKAIQIRVNQLTRELHSLEETIRNHRFLGKKKDRLSSGSESTLIAASKSSSSKKAGKANGQTGIESFFSASKLKSTSKKPGSQVLDLCGPDLKENASKKRDSTDSAGSDSDVEVVSPPNQDAAAERDESDNVEVVDSLNQKTGPSEGGKQAESDESSEVEALPPPTQEDGAAKRKESSSPEASGSPEKKSKLV